MPQKFKNLSERKIEVVESYLRGEMGATKITQELGITESSPRRWVISHKSFGAEGLISRAKNKKYSPELKLELDG